jgi:hypothetical protein
MIVTATFVWAGEVPPLDSHEAASVSGEVLEVKDVEGYTFLRIRTDGGVTWAAIARAPVRKGSTVTIENVTVMHDVESKSLNRTFPTILFGTLVDSEESATQPARDTITPRLIRASFTGDSPVARASGANARTVAEVVTRSAELKDQIVAVRGKVVKYHPEIMGRNWVHLRDGTGSAVDSSNDLLVTTTQETRVGEVVTVQGIVRTDMDFGAGYAYKVLIEEATLQ